MSLFQASRNRIGRMSMVVAGGLLLFAGFQSADAAERASESQILQALRPPSQSRAMATTPSPQDTKRQDVVNRLRSTKSRSLTVDERTEIAAVAKERPNIDLEIYFDFNSAEITSRAVADLVNLGRALTNAELKGGVYLIAGHTDAKGGEEYNQRLSERRAQSVKSYLIRNFGIADDTLVAAGYGKDELKNKANPFAAENRRVKITNLESKQEAGK